MGTVPRWLAPMASLELTVALLATLMLLVALCTVSQAKLGLYGAVETYIRSLLVFFQVPGTGLKVPVLPGGGLVGAALLANLTAAQALRLERSRRKAGLWLVHLGLALLFVGEFVTGFLQVEMQMVIAQGETLNYVESPRELELAVLETAPEGGDQVYSLSERALKRGGAIGERSWPFRLLVKRYVPNATLDRRLPGEAGPEALATQGLGPGLVVLERSPSTSDDEPNQPVAFVEALDGERSLGTWLLSPALGAEQGFSLGGREFRLAFRRKRRYLPFSITLQRFTRELYPGTDIPKRFSSLVRLRDEARREDRDVLISMNQPLRYGGRAFYQSGFAQNDTVSILQVVKNPGWLLPYLACVLVGAGLALHFLLRFAPWRSA